MKIQLKKIGLLSIMVLFLFISCKKDKEENKMPEAVIESPATGKPFDKITLDGSKSTNASSYEWMISGAHEATFVSTSAQQELCTFHSCYH